MTTSIEWTDATWNPAVGCSKVSPGCDHCYAAGVASRGMQSAHRGLAVRGEWTGEVRILPDRLDTPLAWHRPRRVFVGSMTDLFHPDVPASFIEAVFGVMAAASRHTFQVLTKRPQRMAELLTHWDADRLAAVAAVAVGEDPARGTELFPFSWPLPNVWIGTSIESDRYAWRAERLRATPAAVRFLSCEPLLGPLPSLDLTGIDWVIAGGESGHGARPMHPDWVRDLCDRCTTAGIPFLFKQWGAWVPYEPDAQPPFFASQNGDLIDGHHMPSALTDGDPIDGWWWPDAGEDAVYRHVGKKVAGRELDGRTWDEFPEARP